MLVGSCGLLLVAVGWCLLFVGCMCCLLPLIVVDGSCRLSVVWCSIVCCLLLFVVSSCLWRQVAYCVLWIGRLSLVDCCSLLVVF